MIVNKDIKVTGGFVQDLMGIQDVNIKYDYSKMLVDSFATEQEYLKYKSSKLSAKKWNKFNTTWESNRKVLMEPKFEELFNKYGAKIGLTGTNYSTRSNTTLLVEIVKMMPEPGPTIDELRSVKMMCSFRTPDDSVIVRFELTAYGPNLTECFAISGKMMARLIADKIKKMNPEPEPR